MNKKIRSIQVTKKTSCISEISDKTQSEETHSQSDPSNETSGNIEDNATRVMLSPSDRTDGMVILGNSNMIHIDRYSFARVSAYFRTAFFGGFAESKSKCIYFGQTKRNDFLRCCKVLYLLTSSSSPPPIEWMSLQIAFEILETASYLLMDKLLDVLSDVIVAKVNAESLVAAYHKAEYRHIQLARRLWKIIVREFEKLLHNKTYIFFSGDEMMKLLGDKHLNLELTEEIPMLRSWSKNNYSEATRSALTYTPFLFDHGQVGNFAVRNRIPNSVLIAAGGWSTTGPTNLIETFNKRDDDWVVSKTVLDGGPRAYHGMVCVGDAVYSLGGYDGSNYFRIVKKLDLTKMKWEQVGSMHDQRCYINCGVIDTNTIIAFGGHSERKRLRTAEIFNIPTNQWSRIANMSYRRSDGHCVVLNGKVYAVGGFDGTTCHSSVEYYDVNVDEWFSVEASMTSKRSGVCATSLEGIIFICGGFNGVDRLQSAEFMDPREGKFHRVHPMIRERSNFGMETMSSQVIVAGGYDGLGITLLSEMYDFRADSWMFYPCLNFSRSALYLTRIENQYAIDYLLSDDVEK